LTDKPTWFKAKKSANPGPTPVKVRRRLEIAWLL
jgi:hypothetical protein